MPWRRLPDDEIEGYHLSKMNGRFIAMIWGSLAHHEKRTIDSLVIYEVVKSC